MKRNRPVNEVHLVGRVCKGPFISKSRVGTPMMTVILAVQRPDDAPPKRRPDGKRDADYPPVVIQGEIVERLIPLVQNGTELAVVGTFQTRNIEDRSTNPPKKRVAMEVLVTRSIRLTIDIPSANDERASEESADPAPSPEPALAGAAHAE